MVGARGSGPEGCITRRAWVDELLGMMLWMKIDGVSTAGSWNWKFRSIADLLCSVLCTYIECIDNN